MNHATGVSRDQRLGDLKRNPHGAHLGQRSLALEQQRQIFPSDVLEYHVEAVVRELAEIYTGAIPRLMAQSPAAVEVAVEHLSGPTV